MSGPNSVEGSSEASARVREAAAALAAHLPDLLNLFDRDTRTELVSYLIAARVLEYDDRVGRDRQLVVRADALSLDDLRRVVAWMGPMMRALPHGRPGMMHGPSCRECSLVLAHRRLSQLLRPPMDEPPPEPPASS